mmetsp:Transcript_41611/g.75467  ORF Transcript_41611/g.75467 Transcript_41611/m.75467 type:complete len:290 (-) Transcript_41611:2202-3071(-)
MPVRATVAVPLEEALPAEAARPLAGDLVLNASSEPTRSLMDMLCSWDRFRGSPTKPFGRFISKPFPLNCMPLRATATVAAVGFASVTSATVPFALLDNSTSTTTLEASPLCHWAASRCPVALKIAPVKNSPISVALAGEAMLETITLRCSRPTRASLPAAAALSAAAKILSAAALSVFPALAVDPVAGVCLFSSSGSSTGTHSTAAEAELAAWPLEPGVSAAIAEDTSLPVAGGSLARARLRFLAAHGAASSTGSPAGVSFAAGTVDALAAAVSTTSPGGSMPGTAATS